MGFFHCNYYHYRNSFLTHSSLFESALDPSWHHSNTFWYLLCNLTLKDVPSLLYTFPGSELEVAISPRSLGYKNWFFERSNEITRLHQDWSRRKVTNTHMYTYMKKLKGNILVITTKILELITGCSGTNIC